VVPLFEPGGVDLDVREPRQPFASEVGEGSAGLDGSDDTAERGERTGCLARTAADFEYRALLVDSRDGDQVLEQLVGVRRAEQPSNFASEVYVFACAVLSEGRPTRPLGARLTDDFVYEGSPSWSSLGEARR
jgi:hypothetical protein